MTALKAALSRSSTIFRLAIIALAYYASMQLGYYFIDPVGRICSIWPASGVALAAVLMHPKSLRPAIIATITSVAFFSTLLVTGAFLGSLAYLLTSIIDLLLATWVITRFCRSEITFTRVIEIFLLIVVATLCNGFIAILGAAISVVKNNAQFWPAYRAWWTSNCLGILLVAPLVLSWAKLGNPLKNLKWSKAFEAALFMIIWSVTAWLVFHTATVNEPFQLPPYILVILLCWAALRLGVRGVATAMFLLAIISISGTFVSEGITLANNHSQINRLLLVEFYIGITSVTGLLLAASSSETARAEQQSRESQASLLLSEERFRSAMHHSPIGMAIVSPTGNFLDVNPALCQIIGYTNTELMTIDFQSITHPEDINADLSYVQQVLNREIVTYQMEKRYLHKDGYYVWIQLNASLVWHADGQPRHFISQIQDITDRKKAEEALRKSEEMLNQLLDNIDEVFWMTTARFEELLYVSPAYETLWGRSRASLFKNPQSFLELVHPEDFQHVINSINNNCDRGFDVEFRIIKPDNSIRWIWDRGFPVRNAAGEVYRLTGIAKDITARKEAEEHLRSLNQQMSELSANLQTAREEEGARIARELHDEMGSSLTSLKWDLESIHHSVRQQHGPWVVGLTEKATAMLSLVDTMINTVRRISSELRPSVLDDLGLLEAIEWQAQQFETRTGIACQFESFVDFLELDRQQSTAIFRILQEALTNILRHSKANRVNITVEAEQAELVLTIHDNGQGFQESQLKGKSSVGLPGMRERARILGGKITIEARTGRGTIVNLRVPITNVGSIV